ncbi:radical SAM/SPASM domain protein, ACGX system [Eubacteriaceae bacterium ES2]|nr:radical SAM/SPASM domain protein, ACGX system [Eubacteriaceae bacterium ES2]
MKQTFAFQWHITDECDQRCKHCYIFSEKEDKPLSAMTWEQMQAVVNNCLEMCQTYHRLPYFYITGGDPILHPDFWKLLDLFKKNRIPFSIMGNPFHLNDDVCQKLKDYGCEKYQLSLDGLRETHDWFRKKGSFDCTLEKIAGIKKAGIRSVIMSTVSGKNIDQIPQLIDTVVRAGVDVYAFARYCPTSDEKETGMTAQAYRQLLDTCHHKFKQYEDAGCQTYFNHKDHLWTLYEYEEGLFKIPDDAQEGMIYGGCNCGNSHLTILPNGDLYACRRFESKVGNVFNDCISDVWISPCMEAYRDYDKFEKCASCQLLAFCRGCPAVAYGSKGNFYGPDPQCWKETD